VGNTEIPEAGNCHSQL